MSNHVFICHSSEDAALAESVVRQLELRGLRCWLKARDLQADGLPLQAVNKSLRQASSGLVLLTPRAEKSSQVLREAEWLVIHDRPVVVLFLDKTELDGPFNELLGCASAFRLFEKTSPADWEMIAEAIRNQDASIPNEAKDSSTWEPQRQAGRLGSQWKVGFVLAGLLCALLLGLAGKYGWYFGGSDAMVEPERPAVEFSPVMNEESLVRVAPWPIGQDRELRNSIGMKFALIPAGSFTRRSVLSPTKNFTVSLTRPYYLGVTEVNQKQFRRLMGTADSYFQGDLLPVDQATWERAVEFCRRLSELPEEKAAGRTYRLPTEAEWEFASRAGSGKAFFFGENLQQADMFVWYSENSKSIIQDVGIKLPNNWGLYDIYGNVTEWCSDWLAEYPAEGQVDPHGPPAGEYKIIRGGNCGGELWYANSTFRHYGKVRGSEIGLAGLRVICEITEAIHSESEPENTTPFKD